jgi:Hydroxymethylpyrimidine/phosphomethylpyrimidine kinase
LFERTGIPCLVKGGRRGFKVLDVLYDGRDFHEFRHDRLSKNVHGTGCFLSAAILALLASGEELPEACSKGIDLTGKAIGAAPGGTDKRTSFSFSY